MTQAQAQSISLTCLTIPTIARYFATLNQSDFAETANLFAVEGTLYAPFESPIIGRDAIATYLSTEANRMQLYPLEEIIESSEENGDRFLVKGKVQTPVFGVNVAWTFILNGEQEIESVEVKLLASLQELATLRR